VIFYFYSRKLFNFSSIEDTNPTHQPTSSLTVPILQCVDQLSSSLPSWITFTEDIIHASIGFRCVDTLKSRLQHSYQDTVHLDSLPADSVLDLGGLAMSKKTQKNTSHVPRPSTIGEVIQKDIAFFWIFQLVTLIVVYFSPIDIAE
jgi:hypothetical protein